VSGTGEIPVVHGGEDVNSVSTHILDTARGRPAAGVPVALEGWADGGWQRLGGSVTGDDGRAGALPAPSPTGEGGPAICRLVFAVRDYLVAHHGTAFFPEITVAFAAGPGEHYHVPLLLSPYGYSVYRGS
jgi:hydroxyisourate hydrolase